MTSTVPSTVPEWTLLERLSRERGELGIYLSSHPLDAFGDAPSRISTTDASSVRLLDDRMTVSIAGVIESIEERTTRAGKPMAFFRLEDRTGRVRCVLWPKTFAQIGAAVRAGELVFVTGRVKLDEIQKPEAEDGEEAVEENSEPPRMISVEEIQPLETAIRDRLRGITIRVPSSLAKSAGGEDAASGKVRQILSIHPGHTPVNLVFDGGKDDAVWRFPGVRVKLGDKLMYDLKRLFESKEVVRK